MASDDERPRYRKLIETAYLSAFQLLRYESSDHHQRLVWNSRDGEVPSRFTFDGRDYKFRRGLDERSTVLPERADLVVTTYTRSDWEDWARLSWEASCARDAKYIERTPTLAAFLRVAPFEHGMARIVSRHQWLHETCEWQGRLG